MIATADAEQPHRVLVVDDEPNIVDVITMALRFQGFQVASAGTGRDALAAVRSFDPHLMVLDIMLPDMEGFEVAERLGAQRAQVPIIFLTARDAPQDKIRGGIAIAAIPLTEVDATLSRLLLIEALVFGAVLLALGFGAWWLVRIGLRALDAIGATAGAIAAGDLARRVEPTEPRTEVGRPGLSLNAMLGRLEEAFAERRASEERLRRFLADASHELRTPLASIRGYAELFRIGAAAQPADVAKAMTRISLEGASDAVVDGDPGQLRQVLANLMRNALVRTPAGTPIEVSVTTRGGDATLAVRDHGPGLPTDDPSELFDRFWRGDGPAHPHGRGRAGAGLGLAIVAGVVSAHGGHAAAADADGGGARFEIVLPLRAGPG